MKKSIFIIVLLTTILLFSGCWTADTAGLDENGEKLPGSWYKFSGSKKPVPEDIWGASSESTFTNYGDGTCIFASKAGELSYTYKPGPGDVTCKRCTVLSNSFITGFKATAISTPDTYYGFAFNVNWYNDDWVYYRLLFNNDSFTLDRMDGDNNFQTIVDWTKKSAIKSSNQENEILVYAIEEHGNIVIKVNGEKIYTIEDPVFYAGELGAVCCVDFNNYRNDNSINTTFKFEEYQKF